MWKIISLVFKIFVVLCGFGLIALGVGKYGLQSNSINWLNTDGQVVSSESDYSYDTSAYKITYQYVVDGTTYSSSYTDDNAKSPGEKITIYYDPTHPNSSTNIPGGFEFMGFVLLAFGLFCVVSVLWGAIKSIVANRKKKLISSLEKH
jgi:hypothetical protein